jgi:hypothetical protein
MDSILYDSRNMNETAYCSAAPPPPPLWTVLKHFIENSCSRKLSIKCGEMRNLLDKTPRDVYQEIGKGDDLQFRILPETGLYYIV